jgi:glutamate dehydrogenase/leucine dehydrogenase
MRRGLVAATGDGDFAGRRIGVVGLGKVGSSLASKLAEAGAHVVGCDLDNDRCRCLSDELGIQIAPSAEAILAAELDVLAPCAAGGMIDDALAHSIDCRVLAGAANNPLSDRSVARTLMAREILYVPDFLANCGGLIHVSREWYGDQGPGEDDLIAGAMERLDDALVTAEAEGTPPIEVAERQALERVEAARRR